MNNLDKLEIIDQFDQSKMRQVIADLPEHCRLGFKLGAESSFTLEISGVKNIVFCGMGGSAIGAEIASFYLRKELKIPTYVNRDYTLPNFVDQNTLAILVSYSGNTEETLSAYHQARKKNAKIIILTSNGQLAELAKQNDQPFILVPKGFPPRGALALLCFPLLAILAKLGLIGDKSKEVEETACLLEKMRDESLNIDVPIGKNPAKALARQIYDKFCVIYGGSEQLSAVVTRWRGQLAENSKSLASGHVFPEMNHNEIVGWQNPKVLLKKFAVVMLRDKQDHVQVQKRIEISKEILAKEGTAVTEVWSQGQGLLARTFSLIYTGDFVSLYLAILNEEDPTPVKRIDYLKKRLKEWK